jgi:tetratricopeptide (TPR) repeat protein
MALEWYRNEDWSKEKKEAFFEKLKKSRDKVQYLKIQAGHLEKRFPNEALELLMEALKINSNNIFLTQIYGQMAECFCSMGNRDEAIAYYRKSIGAQGQRPSVRTDSYLGFARCVINWERSDLFEEALNYLNQREQDPTFPVQIFEYHLYLTQLYLKLEKIDKAEEHAKATVANMAATKSGFRYHPGIGLVTAVPKEVESMLKDLGA